MAEATARLCGVRFGFDNVDRLFRAVVSDQVKRIQVRLRDLSFLFSNWVASAAPRAALARSPDQ